jgi:hypothetical protein
MYKKLIVCRHVRTVYPVLWIRIQIQLGQWIRIRETKIATKKGEILVFKSWIPNFHLGLSHVKVQEGNESMFIQRILISLCSLFDHPTLVFGFRYGFGLNPNPESYARS